MRVAMDTDNKRITENAYIFQLHANKNMLIKVCFEFHCNATINKDVIWIVYELPNHSSYR